MSEIELIAAILGLIAVALTVRQNPLCWPIGLVMVTLYAWLFYEWRLYANVLLQGVFASLQLYGWWLWTRGADHLAGNRPVSSLSTSKQFVGLLAGALMAVLLGFVMSRYTDASAPWLDATLTAFSLVAQLWMAQKRLQCWWLWIVVDVAYVAFFLVSALWLTAVLYAAFTLLAVQGWWTWRRELATMRT